MSARRMVPRDGTLADAVLEIDSQIEPGDTTQNVEITGAAWDRLLGMAQDAAAFDVGWKEAIELALSEKPDSALERGPWTSHKRALELRKRIVSVARSVLEPKKQPEAFDPLPPAKRVADPGGPFRVLVDNDGVLSQQFDDRQEAYNWATGIGHRSFKVQRADGSICDVVELPAKKQRKPRAVKAFCAKCNDTTKHDGNDECQKCAARELFDAQQKAEAEKTPLEQAIADAGGAP